MGATTALQGRCAGASDSSMRRRDQPTRDTATMCCGSSSSTTWE
jgi:hypothetical protein